MSRLKRSEFIKMGALLMSAPLLNSRLLHAMPIVSDKEFVPVGELLKQLIASNDEQVTGLLKSLQSENIRFSRKIGHDFASLSAAYVSPGSKYFRSALLIPKPGDACPRAAKIPDPRWHRKHRQPGVAARHRIFSGTVNGRRRFAHQRQIT